MPLCYVPAQTTFTLYKTLGHNTEQVDPLVRDYFFKLEDNWFSGDSYKRMEQITLDSEAATVAIQQLVTLTKKHPELLMVVLLRSLLTSNKKWPFPVPKDHNHPEFIRITRVQFQVRERNIAFQCVLNNKHNTVNVSLRDWRNHLLQILEDKRWLGVCETAQLTGFNGNGIEAFQNATFHVDGVALAWDQWCFLMREGTNPQAEPFQQTHVTPQCNVEAYTQPRQQTITARCITHFNKQLSQAWQSYQNNEEKFSYEVAHLKNDLEIEQGNLKSAENTINWINQAITAVATQTERLEKDIATLARTLPKKIDRLKSIYVEKNTKSHYFFNTRYLNNQGKRQTRNAKAILALGMTELPPVTAISSDDHVAILEQKYLCDDEINKYATYESTRKQLQEASVHEGQTQLDIHLHNTPLKYPLAEPQADPSVVSFEDDDSTTSIPNHYEQQQQRYQRLQTQWQARNLCFAAYKRCLLKEHPLLEAEQEKTINEDLLFAKQIIKTLSQWALTVKKALNEAFAAYNAFKQEWQEKQNTLLEKCQSLYDYLYSYETDEKNVPKGLNPLTQYCNTFFNQPQQWAAENHRYSQVIAQYDLTQLATINGLKSDYATELLAIQTLLAGVATALKEPSFLDTFKKGTQQIQHISVSQKEYLMPTIKEAFSESPWYTTLSTAFTAFKQSYYNEYNQCFTLSENTSALLEITFENESKKLLKALSEKSNHQEAHLITFWQLVMISAIIPTQYEQQLITTPHHRYNVFHRLIKKMKEHYNISISINILNTYIYIPQQEGLFNVKSTSIPALPAPFNENCLSLSLNQQQKNRLQQIRSATTPREIQAWFYLDEIGRNIFPKEPIKNYQHAHECFKGPQLMLALYYIELKIQEATESYQIFSQDKQWIGPLAEDFITLMGDILHYPQWQAILKENSETITIINPQNTCETRERTALTFIQENPTLFPNVNAIISKNPALQPTIEHPSNGSSAITYPGNPIHSQENYNPSEAPYTDPYTDNVNENSVNSGYEITW